jgi:small GTP-binding protein
MNPLTLPNQMRDLQVMLRGLDWHAVEREVHQEIQTRLVIVGPVNAGKSTLFNYLHGHRVSATGAVPGTTTGVIEHPLGPFFLVDTPGFGEVWGVDRATQALEAAQQADVVLLLLDAVAGVRQSDRELLDRLRQLRIPLIVALNKIDLVKRETPWVLENAEQVLGERPIPISARTGHNVIDQLLPALVNAHPGLSVALARTLPPVRHKLVQRIIRRTAWFSGLLALQPVPGLDVPILLAAQTRLILRVAAAYGESMSVGHARELLVTMAGGLASRYLAAQLAKLVPGFGWIVSAVIVGTSTWALGEAARRYFEAGRQIPTQTLHALYRSLRRAAPRRLLSKNDDTGQPETGVVLNDDAP